MSQTMPWTGTVIYQLIVRSFADGNGDGIGDFKGLASRLPYLRWLGVKTLAHADLPILGGMAVTTSPTSRTFTLTWVIWRRFTVF